MVSVSFLAICIIFEIIIWCVSEIILFMSSDCDFFCLLCLVRFVVLIYRTDLSRNSWKRINLFCIWCCCSLLRIWITYGVDLVLFSIFIVLFVRRRLVDDYELEDLSLHISLCVRLGISINYFVISFLRKAFCWWSWISNRVSRVWISTWINSTYDAIYNMIWWSQWLCWHMLLMNWIKV